MSKRAVAWLGLLFVAAVVIGLRWSEPETAERADRERVAPREERRPPPPVSTVVAPTPEVAQPGPQAVPAELEVEKGKGLLEVDFEGLGVAPEFSVGADPDHLQSYRRPGSSVAFRVLDPGTYSVYWFLPERVGWHGARVRIEADRVTRLHATGPESGRWPLAEGYGRVEVTVHAVGGGYLPQFEISVGLAPLDAAPVHWDTNRNGQQSFDLRPGRYEVGAGAARAPVEAKAGETVSVAIHPDGLGDLFFEMPPGSPRLTIRTNYFQASWQPGLGDWWSDGRRQGYRSVLPATYEVGCRERKSGNRVGEAEVRAGEATVFRGRPGGIQARIHRPDTSQLPYATHLSVEKRDTGKWVRLVRVRRPWAVRIAPGIWSLSAPYLEPGRYRVHLGDHGERREVEVNDALVVVDLTLDR